MSKNILLQNDFTTSTTRRYSETTTHILDLNYDCLRQIFQHLDLASQYSILKTSPHFIQIILYDIWYRYYYDDTVDITKDQSITKRTQEFQLEFLKLALKRFSNVGGIPIKLFNLCMKSQIKQNQFEQISSLAIKNTLIKCDDNDMLNMKEFLKFPNLQELHIEGARVKFISLENLKLNNLKNLSLISYQSVDDIEGNFLLNIFTPSLENLIIKPKQFTEFSFDNFQHIKQCVELKELTFDTLHFNNSRILDYLIALPHLEILTLHSYNNFYFSSKDHTIFYAIMKIIHEHPHKILDAVEINGIPNQIFFKCPYLQDVPNLNWIATKIFHRKLDGSVEWKSDIPHVIKSFYDFIANSKYLQNLYVRDNMFHKKRGIKEKNLIENLQQSRSDKGYDKLQIFNCNDNKGQYYNNIAEGSVRFFIRNHNFIN